jgi:trk system potassium uptake protein TrkH
LVVVDTATHWSLFGQTVIIILVQLGGLGFMTSATLFLLAFGRRIGLREKVLISESIGITRLGGIVKVVGLMVGFTLLVEAVGTALFYIHFSETNPLDTSLWLSVFHAVSSFNNAGFDLAGGFQSMVMYQRDPIMLLITAGLIIIGGIGFLMVVDLFRAKGSLFRLSLDSKMVLTATVFLLVFGTAVILVTEFTNPETLGSLSLVDRVLNAFFQSVVARTAGFSSVNMSHMANYTLFFMALLMFVGGASGSTAGGVKLNNITMLAATIWSTMKGREHAGAFGREFSVQQINRALTVALLSLGFVAVIILLLTLTERFDFMDLFFETLSAFSNTGLSTGITPDLSIGGRIIIIVTMFIGRLGPLTVALALVQGQRMAKFRYPQETVRTG